MVLTKSETVEYCCSEISDRRGGEKESSGGRMGEEGGKEGAMTQHHLLVVKLTVCHSHWPPASSSNTLNPPSNRKAATIPLISLSSYGWVARHTRGGMQGLS